jgi:uncharacterized protein YndB with AHSA1/START domain
MNNEPFVIERTFNATVAKVWEAITNKDAMKQWYFDLAAFKPEVGFEFQFYGQSPEGEKFLHHCKITDVVVGKKIRHSWSYENYEGMSFVKFELFDEGEKTRIKLTHEGLETFPQNNPAFAKNNFAEGWTYIIGKSLLEFVEAN